MRTIIAIAAALLVTGALQLGSGWAVLGQERPAANLRTELFRLANGRAEFDVADPALVPSQLAEAATQSGCRWQDIIKQEPLHVFRIKGFRFAMIACEGSPGGGGHQVFDLQNVASLKFLAFPIIGYPDGFATSLRPGMMTWKPDSGLLQAESGSDNCFKRIRYTYRSNAPGFAIIRVEVTSGDCTQQGPWKTIWDAPNWSVLARPDDR
jgi:hypothetical protein